MTPEIELLLWLGLAFVGMFASAMCSGLETATYTVDRVRLDLRAEGGDRAAIGMLRELKRPDRALTALLIGNNTANYLGTLGVTAALAMSGLGETAVAVLATVIVTPLLVTFAEALPKELFRANADTMGVRLAWILRVLRLAGTAVGVLPVLTALGRLVAGRGEDPLAEGGRAGLVASLREALGDGPGEAELVDRALEMRDRVASDQMVPWDRVAALMPGWSLEEARACIRERPHEIYPVVGESGRVRGVVSASDVLTTGAATVSALMREPVEVEPDAPLRRVALALAASGERAAVVVGLGSPEPIGLVSFPDLVGPLLEPGGGFG